MLVDPPRQGLDEGTRRTLGTFKRIIYISCNPTTMLSDIAHLQTAAAAAPRDEGDGSNKADEGGADEWHGYAYRVSHFAIFDQFPYTHHLECGVVMHKESRSVEPADKEGVDGRQAKKAKTGS